MVILYIYNKAAIISKVFILAALFPLLLCSCVTTTPQSIRSFSAKEIDHCYAIFSDIMTIQDERSQLADSVNAATSSFNNGSITRADYHLIRTEWLGKENALASSVNAIYNRAYNIGCFDELANPQGQQ